MFNERKVAQMAAFLIDKEGGTMSHLKLMKLLYLSDREAMERYGFPMSGDCIVAMTHGPVLSRTLDLMDGNVESSPDGWDSLISAKANHELSLNASVAPMDLDELSQADLEVLEAVWVGFGFMGKYQIRDYTHDSCPEWIDPHGSSNPIHYESVFRALGRSPDVAAKLSARIEEERALDKIFASL